MLFGSEKSGGVKGIALDMETLTLKVVDVVDGDWQAAGVIVHNVKNRALAHMLVEMPFGPFPMALGVIYDDARPSYEEVLLGQDEQARKGKDANLAKLLGKGQTWTVSGTAADPV
jgi:2-oxoglutarate ferredoxin oxidoreductase subunit beta